MSGSENTGYPHTTCQHMHNIYKLVHFSNMSRMKGISYYSCYSLPIVQTHISKSILHKTSSAGDMTNNEPIVRVKFLLKPVLNVCSNQHP